MLPASLILLLPLAPTPPAAERGAAPALLLQDEPRPSLEELLRRAREKREENARRLGPRVDDLVRRLDALGASGAVTEIGRVRDELVALGPEAAPLLLPHLDPGATSSEGERARARHVGAALQALGSGAVTRELIHMARTGSKEGRTNAMEVLGSSPDVELASACLADIFRNAKGPLRTGAVTALARLGGPGNEALLLEALGDDDPEVLKAVLAALTGVRSSAALAQVRDLAGAPMVAAPLVPEILAYYRSCADALEEDDLQALVRLAAHDAPSPEDRLRVLDTLPALTDDVSSRTEKLFDPLLASKEEELQEAARICLALLGDRGQRREILKRYDDLVDQNENWSGAYSQRAAIHLRLGDPGEAAKDYRRAIQIREDQGRPLDEELYVQLARAYSLDGNAKKAHDALQTAGLSRSELRALALDPDFGTIRDHSRYGKIFDV